MLLFLFKPGLRLSINSSSRSADRPRDPRLKEVGAFFSTGQRRVSRDLCYKVILSVIPDTFLYAFCWIVTLYCKTSDRSIS